MQYGTAEKSSPSGRMVVLRMGNLNNGEISFKDVVYTSNESDIKKYRLLPGDLLFNRTNSSEKVGGTAIYRGQQPAIFAGYLIRIAPSLVDREFLNIVMNSSYEREFCQRNKHDAVHQSNISAATIATFPIPLPPLAEQRRIVLRLKKLEALCDEIDSEANSLTTLSTQAKARILDLAIRGALVPQDPADEPASALLSRIRTTADKPPCTKREKNRRTGSVDVAAPPFSIPKSWEWTTIGAICDVIMGQSPEGTFVSSSCNGIEFHQGKIFFGNKYLLFSDKTTVSPTKVVDPGTILLCVRAPVGKVNITSRRICIGRGLCGIRSSAMIDNDYLYLLLQSYEEVFNSNAIGSTFKAISCDVIRKQPVPLPPLDEQRRIVAKVEELFAAIDQALG